MSGRSTGNPSKKCLTAARGGRKNLSTAQPSKPKGLMVEMKKMKGAKNGAHIKCCGLFCERAASASALPFYGACPQTPSNHTRLAHGAYPHPNGRPDFMRVASSVSKSPLSNARAIFLPMRTWHQACTRCTFVFLEAGAETPKNIFARRFKTECQL